MPKLVSHGNASASRCLCIGLGNQMFSSGVAAGPVLTAREFIIFSKTDGWTAGRLDGRLDGRTARRTARRLDYHFFKTDG